MPLTSDVIPVLTAAWHLRPNFGAGVAYRFDQSESKIVYLTSAETVAVGLCDGRRTAADILSLLADLLELSEEEPAAIWDHLIAKSDANGPFLAPLNEAGTEFTRPNASRILREIAEYVPVPKRVHRVQAPLNLVLMPTWQCAADCVYCYSQRPALSGEPMPLGRWIEVLTEAGELGVDIIGFSGGDAMLFPGLEKLLEVACRYRMSYLLPTKTLITPARAERLALLLGDYGEIQVSVDSFDPEIARRMTRVERYAEIARRSIVNLIAAGVPVRTNTVVTPLNLAGMEDLVRELHALRVHRAHITSYSRTHYRHDDGLFLTPEQMSGLNDTIGRISAELDWPDLKCNASPRDFGHPGGNPPEAWKQRSTCSGGFNSCAILPNGDVILCEQVPADDRFVVGNLCRQSLAEVWNSERLFEFLLPARDHFEGRACAGCDEFDPCHRVYGRCFRDAYFNYGTPFAPPPNCPKAPPGLRMG